ncbi:conserved protein, unknown function [Plasmodium yoelii]|uniref:Uncharacterized protein n=2 Tax=Plasmodium yoelii TaxID=5861 RepID=A0AAE9WV84_PLAYO|nr:conserved protein, unknown function [Plasmodium yoelii]WBY60700.1 hypothetical protein Py17XNL_001400991 [Plasmodium yoelii yoelii]CDU20495.1 conserved Plasmodium protein, unknown function [Plasmodium yoelii]VTZ81456.1 conserved protein, unknown function [Plasmodium yoelii]|eukprot:XP_022812849.1 conserved protein, unknown function [Plasmodium yoelii]
MISSRAPFLKVKRNITFFQQIKNPRNIEIEKKNAQENAKIFKRNIASSNVSNVTNKTDLNTSDNIKNNVKDVNSNGNNGNEHLLNMRIKRDGKEEENSKFYLNKQNGKRNYTINSFINIKNNKMLANVNESENTLLGGSSKILLNNGIKGKLNSNNNNNNNGNMNNTNIYINKLHDYLDISHKSEGDKIRINKILSKLRNDNITISVILDVLKNLCNIFLKKSSQNNLDNLIIINNLNNNSITSKNVSKKLKNYFEEYFINISKYIIKYISFINEHDIFNLYKYLYYLNYPLSQDTMELLQEQFYLHIDKLDSLKVAQIFYIINTFYKNSYLKEPDSFFVYVIDEKFKNSYNNNGHKFYATSTISKENDKYLYKNILFDSNLNNNYKGPNIEAVSNSQNYKYNEEHYNKYPDMIINNSNSLNQLNPITFNKQNSTTINVLQSDLLNTLPNYKKYSYNSNETITENNELLLVFKYIQNFHHKMNFFYDRNIMNNLEKSLNNFSIETLLLILNIYINNNDELFNRKILNVLYYNIDNMNEQNLILLTDYFKNTKILMNSKYYTSNDINEISIINKIIDKIKKDNDLIIPNNLACIYLNLYDVVNKIPFSNSSNNNMKNNKQEYEHFNSPQNQNTNENMSHVNNSLNHGITPSDKTVYNLENEYNFQNNEMSYKTNENINEEDTQYRERNNLENYEKMENIKNNMINDKYIDRSALLYEIIKFCDGHINNISCFSSILDLYLIYIKNEVIKSKTIQIFEKKIKTNKNKLTQQNISNIIMSLSIHPYHYTQMFTYLESLLNEKLNSINNNEENQENNLTSINEDDNQNNISNISNTSNETEDSFSDIDPNCLIDISLAFGISGRHNFNLWKFVDVHKIILTCNKKLLLYLSYSFLLTNYFCPTSWFFIIKRIVEDVKGFNKKQYELLYEILKCSILFNYIDLNNFTNMPKKFAINFNSPKTLLNNKNDTNNFLKNFHYLLNTSYYHYKLKLINNQYNSNVPYEEVFNYLKLNYEKNIEFKQLYIIPFLLKDYNVIIDPLPSTPIHKSSGYIMGEIQLKHKVFRHENYVVLSFYDGMWDEFIKQSTNSNIHDKNVYDVKALAERFKTYTESHIKIKINKNNISTPSTLVYNHTKNKTNTQANYLKYKKQNVPQENTKKYLVNKTNRVTNNQDKKKYLKIRTKAIKKN